MRKIMVSVFDVDGKPLGSFERCPYGYHSVSACCLPVGHEGHHQRYEWGGTPSRAKSRGTESDE